MDIEKRDEQIHKLREEGATFSHIASLFNISTTRVTQLYYRTRYKKEHYDSWPPLMKMLSTRPKNALTDYFRGENILGNPQKLAEFSRVKLAKIKNLGQKSVKEIGSALHALGYIEDMDSW